MTEEEYRKILKQFHKLSDRHILVAKTDMPYSDVVKVVTLSDKIRKAGNELVGLMRKNYDQLLRTKRYRKLLKLYGNTQDKDKRMVLAKQLNEMQSELCRINAVNRQLAINEDSNHLRSLGDMFVTEPKMCRQADETS